MSYLLRSLIIFTLLAILFERCANPTAITGGPKDSIPPELIQTIPIHESINVKETEFSFEFSEPINADKLTTELLITPTTETRFTHVVKKNELVIKFEEAFADSTTFTFNFRKGVGDATEKNPVENFKYAFSTGPYIDSLSINGYTRDLITEEDQKEITVGLYEISDTLKVTDIKPYYFFTTDEKGYFQIENIKAGNFLLFAFKDENNNLIFNPKDEAFAIYEDTLMIQSKLSYDSLILYTQKLNAEELKLRSARPSGRHYIAQYSKPITIKNIEIDSSQNSSPFIHYNSDQTEVIFYNNPTTPLAEGDSIKVELTVRDTLNTSMKDTLYVKYLESNRTGKDLSFSAYDLKYSDQILSLLVKSSKPILEWNPTGVTLSIDTIYSFNPSVIKTSSLNKYIGAYKIEIPFNSDSIYAYVRNTYIPDSIEFEDLTKLGVTLQTNFLKSVELDTLAEAMELTLKKPSENKTGQINVTIETEYESFQIRLLDKKNKIVRTSENLKQFSFFNLPPDTYTIEIYVDENNNGIWEVANPHLNKKSEMIYRYPFPTELKSNWIIDIEDISF